MTTIDRGRGRGGARGGRGGADGGPPRRGAWRGGPPPGSAGSYPNSRGASPVVGSPVPGAGPRTSINDHMNDMKKVIQEDKSRGGKGFQTDTDISRASGPTERELKPWVSDAPDVATGGPRANGSNIGGRDSDTFGAGSTNIPWDQFEANERLFGAKTTFQEEIYTTKLNKSGADFKKREKEAEKLANEIMGQTSKNVHVAEERGQLSEGPVKDEEEKYSGVVRAPNAYVPPAARRAAGLGGVTPRVSAHASAANTPSVKTNGSGVATPAIIAPKAVSPSPMPSSNMAVPAPPARSASEDPASASAGKGPSTPETSPGPVVEKQTSTPAAPGAAPLPPVAHEHKDTQLGGVVDQWRQFVGTERERVEAKKQSVMKSERERMLADFKKFHTDFKVPLPIPKDILPILSKDQGKQKDIEAKAADALEKAREAKKAQVANVKSPSKVSAPMETAKSSEVTVPKIIVPKKIAMKIPEIPPFNPKKPAAAPVPVPETAAQNIPTATSPTPSITSLASGSQAKLNPSASSFVFKPNPSAAAFKPGQPSGSPAQAPRQSAGASPVAAAGPSATTSAPKNPFFRDKVPEKITVNMRDDFNPWRHGQVPSASSIGLQWPYSGRKHHGPSFSVSGPVPGGVPPAHMNFDEDGTSPRAGLPHMMQGMPPNYQQFGYRFNQPGAPAHGIPGQMQGPMFSPGPQFSPLPAQQIQHVPQHLGGPGPQPNGMPIYFQNGIPQNPAFLPPQHMQYNPHQHTPQRHGPGPGPGPGLGQSPAMSQGQGQGGPMYYPNPNQVGVQLGTPHQTPQMVQHNLPYPGQPPAQPQFQPQNQGHSPGTGPGQ